MRAASMAGLFYSSSSSINFVHQVHVDHLHQPRRTFASIINKCLSGKVSGLDMLRLSRAQILWGMYHKKNFDFVALIWEDLAYQIDKKDSKKQDKMFYPRFTKIIIHHFLIKDKSISMRNRTFMHTDRDNSLLGTMRFVSRHEDTQVYGALIPKAMTNQALLDSVAYKTYYAIATGSELLKPKKSQKKSDSAISSEETSSKIKPAKAKKDVTSTKKPTSKPKSAKKKALVKADKGDGTNFQSGVPDEKQRKISGTDKGTSAKLGVPDVPKYDYESDKESWGDSGEEDDDDEDDIEDDIEDDDDNDGNDDGVGNDDDDDNDGNDNGDGNDDDNDGNDDGVGNDDDDNDGNDDGDGNDDDDNDGNDDDNDDSDHESTESDRDENPNLNQSNEEHEEEEEYDDEFNDKEDDVDYAKEDNEEKLDDAEELYKDVNVNLRKEDVEMTDVDQGGADQHNVSQESGFEQEEEDSHVTLTAVYDAQKNKGPMQSSSVLSDFTEKLLNFENVSPADNEIASLMDTTIRHEEPSGQTSSLYTIPITVILKITSTFTTTIPPPPPSFNPLLQKATPTPTPTASEVTTSFPALLKVASVFRFNDRVTSLERDMSEMKQVDQYAQAISSIPAIVDCYINNRQRESIQQAIKSHTAECREEALVVRREYIDLIDTSVRAIIKEESTYEAAASLSEFELTKILMDRMEEHKSYLRADYKRELYDALVKSYNTDNDIFDTYGEVFTLKRSREDKDKYQDPSVGSDRGTKRRKSSKDVESYRDPKSKESKSTSSSKGTSRSQHKSSGKSAHVEKPSHTVGDSGVRQNQEFDTGNNDEQPC
ncbi:hypothetical protein Tco_0727059 [Tanacetum coccineum]|uniref:Uncharacterized protein n=1 Tax=Tanacetum coccineum TaxID=301880 RepID=A0ABQ4YKA8_9ASTR